VTELENEVGVGVPRGIVSAFLNPWFQIALGAVLTSVAELLLKKGAVSASEVAGLPGWAGVGALTSGWTWLGIAAYLGSFASWLRVLRVVPLNLAYSLVNVAQVLVPIGAAVLLDEHVSPTRWLGIALVMSGLLILVNVALGTERRA
jgi:multidrug transporter EmrE-like cation transporter